VFGFAAHYHHFEDQIGPGLMADHFAGIRPILFLRRDRMAQAAEWAKATLLGRADSEDGEQSASGAPRYDAKLVDDLADQIAFEERGWRDYFEAEGVVPHVVFHEDLMLDFGGTIRAVFEYLGLEPPRALEDQTLSETANQPIDLWAWRSRRGITGSRRREGPTRRAATPTSKAWASTPQPVSLLTGP
jgi:LPS sulfotransferase NodH